MSFNYVPSSLPAPGTSGNVLTSNGTNWTSAAASSGAMTLIQTITCSGQIPRIEFTSIGNYTSYVMILRNVLMGSAGYTFVFQQGIGATPTYLSSGSRVNTWFNTGSTNNTTPTWSVSTGYSMTFNSYSTAGVDAIINIAGTNNDQLVIYGQVSGPYNSSGFYAPITMFTAQQTTVYTTTAFALWNGNGGQTFGSGSVSLYGISS